MSLNQIQSTYTSKEKKYLCQNEEIVIQAEKLYLIQSTIKNAKNNLKKLKKIYNRLNVVEPKKLNDQCGTENNSTEFLKHVIYYEMWFIFIDELVHIQKELIDLYMIPAEQRRESDIIINDRLKFLIKPVSIFFAEFKPPCIRLIVPN